MTSVAGWLRFNTVSGVRLRPKNAILLPLSIVK